MGKRALTWHVKTQCALITKDILYCWSCSNDNMYRSSSGCFMGGPFNIFAGGVNNEDSNNIFSQLENKEAKLNVRGNFRSWYEKYLGFSCKARKNPTINVPVYTCTGSGRRSWEKGHMPPLVFTGAPIFYVSSCKWELISAPTFNYVMTYYRKCKYSRYPVCCWALFRKLYWTRTRLSWYYYIKECIM